MTPVITVLNATSTSIQSYRISLDGRRSRRFDSDRMPLGDIILDGMLHQSLLLETRFTSKLLCLDFDEEACATTAGLVNYLASTRPQSFSQAIGHLLFVVASCCGEPPKFQAQLGAE